MAERSSYNFVGRLEPGDEAGRPVFITSTGARVQVLSFAYANGDGPQDFAGEAKRALETDARVILAGKTKFEKPEGADNLVPVDVEFAEVYIVGGVAAQE